LSEIVPFDLHAANKNPTQNTPDSFRFFFGGGHKNKNPTQTGIYLRIPQAPEMIPIAVDDALLNEVHLVSDRAVPNDDVAGQEDLELELGDDVRDEVVVGVREEGHGGDQSPTVEIDYLLYIRSQCTTVRWYNVNSSGDGSGSNNDDDHDNNNNKAL